MGNTLPPHLHKGSRLVPPTLLYPTTVIGLGEKQIPSKERPRSVSRILTSTRTSVTDINYRFQVSGRMLNDTATIKSPPSKASCLSGHQCKTFQTKMIKKFQCKELSPSTRPHFFWSHPTWCSIILAGTSSYLGRKKLN